MSAILNLLQRESPLTLVRETLWRAEKRWKRMRLPVLVEQSKIPLQFNILSYYRGTPSSSKQDSCRAILTYAESVKRGYFPRFGSRPIALGSSPDWHVDFVANRRWPVDRSESLIVVRFDGSDVKVPWEFSRLQFLPVLGKAWRLSEDVSTRQCAKNLLTDWIEKNPVSMGINWTIAMEAALRGISICLFLDLLAPFSGEEQIWLANVTRSLWEHLHFIEAHNEFSHFARSNHYLSNIVGLLCLSAYLSGPGMDDRFRRYCSLVQREIQYQVYADGVDYEASLGYHLLILQMFTTSLRIMQLRGVQPRKEFLDRLCGMYRFLAVMSDRNGGLPQVGDCDDGRVELVSDDLEQMMNLPPEQHDSLLVRQQLGMGGRLLERDFGGQSDDADWLEPPTGSVEKCEVPQTAVFPQGGCAVARRGEVEVFFFAMPNGIAGRGSHTHNDKLSIVIRFQDVELLMDSGTCCYTRDIATRNLFRATAAHNTICVDGKEQNEFAPDGSMLFRMNHDASMTRIEHRETERLTYLQAEHSGYEKLGVLHRRSITVCESRVIVEDMLAGTGKHSIVANWHLPKSWDVAVVCDRGREIVADVRSTIAIKMIVQSDAEMEFQSAPTHVSRAYGRKSEAVKLTTSLQASMPISVKTTFLWQRD